MFTVSLYHYTIPFTETVLGKTEKEGVIMKIIDDSRHTVYGDISILPSNNTITITDIVNQVKSYNPEIEFENQPLYPCVIFGIESAYLSLMAKLKGTNIRHYLNPNAPEKIRLNTLIQGSTDRCLTTAKQAIAMGYTHLKLKVGHRAPEDDINLINDIIKILPKGSFLRLDANRQWDITTAIKVGKSINSDCIEYIEDPTSEYSEHAAFYKETGISVAWDKIFRDYPSLDLNTYPEVSTIVIKPSLMGSLSQCLTLCQSIQSLGKTVVISAAFESAVGISTLANMAASIAPETVHGLDTGRYLSENLLPHDLDIKEGYFYFNDSHTQLNTRLLTSLEI